MAVDSVRAQLAQAVFLACRGQKHPANGGEHWHTADRLRPYFEAHAADVAARELEAIASQLAWRQKWRTVRLIRQRVRALQGVKTP